MDHVEKQYCGTKRDAAQYIPLKDIAAWDKSTMSVNAQAREHEMKKVFDTSYALSTTKRTSLFDKKQKYLYEVLEKTKPTNKENALIRIHQRIFDTQISY